MKCLSYMVTYEFKYSSTWVRLTDFVKGEDELDALEKFKSSKSLKGTNSRNFRLTEI